MKKMIKSFTAITLSTTLVLSSTIYIEAESKKDNITLYVNGTDVKGTEQPIIIDGVTYLPIRAMGEALGVDVAYDSKTQKVTLKGEETVVFTVGENTYTVDGEGFTTNAKPFVKLGRTYVPVKAVSEAFGADVAWDGKTKSVFVYKDFDDIETLKVAMTSDSGTIDDKSFNQMTWEGIQRYASDNFIESWFIRPAGEADSDYLEAFEVINDGDYDVIFAPGFKFETAVGKAQYLYPDTKFVIIDGIPQSENYETDIAENTEALLFNEVEPGFYAGLVSAIMSETGKVGFVGGMEIPAVQKFGWGYVAGVAYANKYYGTDVEVSEYMYQGTFNDVAAGQRIANEFYDSGCDIILHAAGGVGVGVINEARTRRQNGENVWVVGVDVDQYEEGIIEDGTSAVLTSAMKHLDEAVYTTLGDIENGEFRGGEIAYLDSTENAVGLPKENPNLSQEALDAYNEVYKLVASETVVVPSTREELMKFLENCGYTTKSGIYY